MKVTITEKDLWHAYMLHQRPNGVVLVALLFFGAVFATYAHEELGISLSTIVVGVIGGVIRVIAYYYVLLRYRCKKIYRQQKNLHTPYDLSWNEKAIHMESEYGSGSVPWSDFVKYKENDKFILMYYSDALFNLVTTSSFDSDQMLKEFRSHLSKVGG